MLRRLRIKNFKGWKDTGEIWLAPITLFFGANSSGKSSIGQFLMMLKQTVESADRKSPLFIGTKNSAINLGSYFDMLHNRNKQNTLSFSYQWDFEPNLIVGNQENDNEIAINKLRFEAELKITSKKPNSLYVNKMEYEVPFDEADEGLDNSFKVGMNRVSEDKNQYTIYNYGVELKRNVGRPWSPGNPMKYYGFPDEVVAYHKNAGFVQDLNLANERLFRQICYLGPIRIPADRTYTWTGTAPDSVGYNGENTISAILSATDRRLNFGRNKTRYSFQEIIAMKLKEMGLIDDFKLELISEYRQDYVAKIMTKGSKSYVDLPDVGFGVSQVLPVLTQIFYAPANSIIIMEQPEIHLHPSAQSVLADVMIDAINSTENGIERNIQLIIETHSEHFLRRLQRRIAESNDKSRLLDKSDVEAYFSSNSRYGAQLTALKVDEYGSIKNWPENFFGDEMEDIAAQSKAALEKRSKKSQ